MIGIFTISCLMAVAFGGTSATTSCYQCFYNGAGDDDSCVTSPDRVTNVVECGNNTCETVARILNFNTLQTLSRGCSTSSKSNCCEKPNASPESICTSTCSTSLCNSQPYNVSAVIDTLPRCPKVGNRTHSWCNFCLTSGNQDMYCIEKPNSVFVSQTLCHLQTSFCTVDHEVYTNGGAVYSYERKCTDRAASGFGLTIGGGFKTWKCHCEADHCNDNTDMGTDAECHPGVTRCYKCQYNGTGDDDSCVTSPDRVANGVVDCVNTKCETVGQIADGNTLQTLSRGCSTVTSSCCSEKELEENNSTTRVSTCSLKCDTHLCNWEPYNGSAVVDSLLQCQPATIGASSVTNSILVTCLMALTASGFTRSF